MFSHPSLIDGGATMLVSEWAPLHRLFWRQMQRPYHGRYQFTDLLQGLFW